MAHLAQPHYSLCLQNPDLEPDSSGSKPNRPLEVQCLCGGQAGRLLGRTPNRSKSLRWMVVAQLSLWADGSS